MGVSGISSCSIYIPQCKSVFSKNCGVQADRPAPNPSPARYEMQSLEQFETGYWVVRVKYIDCTNFEGLKILVMPPEWKYEKGMELDPHFQKDITKSPIARFRPTYEGYNQAVEFANSLTQN